MILSNSSISHHEYLMSFPRYFILGLLNEHLFNYFNKPWHLQHCSLHFILNLLPAVLIVLISHSAHLLLYPLLQGQGSDPR